MIRLLAACALSVLMAACASAPRVERWSAAPISSDQFESHPAFDPVTRDVYFVRGTPDFSNWRLMVSRCGAHHQLQQPAPPSFADANAVEADPWFANDNTLYFISVRPENGVAQQELDIWRVRRAHGVWGAPEHLPPPVNSEGQEWFPRVGEDGWLYFGSSRPGGFGRTDIYRAQEDGVGGWRVENLGPNINTPGDEFEAEISADGRRMILMADGDLYQSELRDGRWQPRVKLENGVNTSAMEVGALLAPSGQAMLYARDSGDPALSGEIYQQGAAAGWPPRCR